jgi:CBS domain-containing protein
MIHSTPIENIMTKNLITVPEDEIVSTVAKIIEENGFHHVPVVNSNSQLVGIVSLTDLERLKLNASIFKTKKQEEYNQALFESLMVKYIMTKNVTQVKPSDSIYKIYSIFKENKFRALPVVEKNQLCGIITPLDLLEYFCNC